MRSLKIISVCGSGTVTSSMVATKVKDILSENGVTASTVEVNPSGAEELVNSGAYDLIVHTSPLVRKYDMPTLNAVGLLTGMGEEEFIEALIETGKELANA